MAKKTIDILNELKTTDLVSPLDRDSLTKVENNKKDIFIKLLDNLISLIHQEKVILVFRGENKNLMIKKLFERPKDIKDCFYYYWLFYFGDKAKDIYKNTEAMKKFQNHIKDINDISRQSFDYIFDIFYKIFNYKKNIIHWSENQYNTLSKWRKSNDAFVQYFSDKNNKTNFYAPSIDVMTKIIIRDYYVYLLHGFGENGLKDESFYVSTTRNADQAQYFARKIFKTKGIIFFYMIPEPIREHANSISLIKEYNTVIDRYYLPRFNSDLYVSQNEIAVKGGLFPHYILGVFDLDEKKFVINRYLYEDYSDDDFNSIPLKGFTIDQDNFEQLIERTGYKGFYTRYWGGYYQTYVK